MNFPVTIRVEPFRMPNYMRPVGMSSDSTMDVGLLFPTDEAAAVFWDELKTKWLQHVAERRAALNGPAEPR
jgi:hypothetical protein